MDLFNFDHTIYDLNFVKSWYTVCDQKYNVPPHHHSCSHISYVYYLQTPKDDPLCFRIDNPNEWFGDAFFFSFKRDEHNSWIHTVQPSDETLLIFPGKIQQFTTKMADDLKNFETDRASADHAAQCAVAEGGVSRLQGMPGIPCSDMPVI